MRVLESKLMKSVKGAFAVVAAATALALAQPVAAQTVTPPTPTAVPPVAGDEFADDRRVLQGGRAVFGENFVLRSNETLRGDLAVFGGDVVLERGSIVEGDAALFGGTLQAAGRITGDLVQMGGDVVLKETARVDEESHRLGGSRTVLPGAYVREEVRYELTPNGWSMPNFMRPMQIQNERSESYASGGDVWKVFPGALLITLLALIVWALLPRNIDRAADVARAQPLFVGGVGALSLIAGAIALLVSLVLIVTLCTNPLIATAAISLSWTVTARIIGDKSMQALGRGGWTPSAQIVIGSLLMALLGAIPLIGNLFGFAFVSLGLGALVLTRLGTRGWRPPEEGPQTADRLPRTE